MNNVIPMVIPPCTYIPQYINIQYLNSIKLICFKFLKMAAKSTRLQ